ncbi:Tn3 family transposase [Nonomuraea angiospora]
MINAFNQPDIASVWGDGKTVKAIDWRLIETHWRDLLRTAISIQQNRISSVTLLRRLGNHSRKNRRRRPPRRSRRPGHHLALHRPRHPPVRQQDPQPQHSGRSHHPPRS